MSRFPLDDRYRDDPTFRAIVMQFEHVLATCEELGIADPGELRTALVYACVRREMMRATPFVYDPETGELRKETKQ